MVSATDVIRGTIELHHREGAMIKQDRDMLGSILDLNDVEVLGIMTHRRAVEALDADQPVDQLIHQAVSTMHSRIPLYRGEPDNIVGLLHMKSLIKLLNELRLAGSKVTGAQVLGICQKPWFIPETTTLHDQLLAFRSKRQHFAFVVDEYGAWQGIVTLEDIIEEIVGNIEDEHDERDNAIQKVSDTAYLVQGIVPVRDVNRQLDWHLPDEHASTVAGLLIHMVQSIPPVGAQFELFDCRFTVVAKDATRITRLRIEKLQQADGEKDL
jgi:Mg2+/Co2+ transporter CorB